MNAYGSVVRTLSARNVLETVIAPPMSVSVLPADWKGQIFQDTMWVSSIGVPPWLKGSNLILRRVGLFSNFADGLVFATPCQRLRILIEAYPYTLGAQLTGSVSWPADSKTMTGTLTAFNTELYPGAVVKIRAGGAPCPILGIVETVLSPTSCLMSDYGPGGANLANLVTVIPQPVAAWLVGVSLLNYMHEAERFIPAGVLGGNLDTFFLKASIVQGSGNLPAVQPVEFLTKTIDTAFARDSAFFDVVADLEITPRSGLTA
jgi:hypothetical protein